MIMLVIHVERAIDRLKNTHYLVKLSHCHSVLFFFTYGVCMRLSSKSPGTYCQVAIIRQRYM